MNNPNIFARGGSIALAVVAALVAFAPSTAIAQHEHLVGVGAAHEHAGIATRTARLADADAGHR